MRVDHAVLGGAESWLESFDPARDGPLRTPGKIGDIRNRGRADANSALLAKKSNRPREGKGDSRSAHAEGGVCVTRRAPRIERAHHPSE